MAPKKSIKTSLVWNYFKEKPKSDAKAICNICKQEISYKSTSNNLRKHIERKHPTIKFHTEETANKTNTSNLPEPMEISDEPQPSTSKSLTTTTNQDQPDKYLSDKHATALKQTSVNTFLRKKMGVTARKQIDDSLMLLFIHDFQPFSIVEDYGFKKFVSVLNPSYDLPSRKTITKSFVTAAYEETYNETKIELNQVQSVTLTTDCWTSRNTENFLGVTAHFICDDFQIKTVLLDCTSFPESHTSVNLAAELKKIIEEWNLNEKILMVVSDNAANIRKAIKDELRLKHFGCYAHTINLIVQDALKHIIGIVDKIKSIVAHFKRSTSATAKLIEQQKRLGLEPKKLIQDVSTRWNSTYHMIERFTELEEPIRTTMALINTTLPIVSMEEWEFLKEITKVLEPMDTITNFMSGEKFVTASSVIILTDGLMGIYKNFKNTKLNKLSLDVINTISKGISFRLGNLECSNSLLMTAFLDPRFKNLGFSHETIGENTKKTVISLITTNIKNNKENVRQEEFSEPSNYTKAGSLWESFEKKIATYQPTGTAQSRAIIEVQRYLEEPLLARNEDPFKWWKSNAYNFPYLSELVKQKFVVVATSVPCERLFSKSGQILSERRNRLSTSKVKQLLFLKYNKKM